MKSQTLNQDKDANLWYEVPAESLNDWNPILEKASCPYRQFPYWVKAHKEQGYTPRFFYCGDQDHPTAVVAILEVGIYPFRSALIDRGPFFFEPEDDNTSAYLSSLVDLLRKLGYVFARFTRGQESVFSKVRDLNGVEQTEPYPFCRDSRNSMLIEQKAEDSEMMSGFSETLRKRIRRAVRFNYDIRATDTDLDFEKAWELFEKLASKKGFDLSPKPKEVWRAMLKHGSPDNFARLYLCSDQGELIAAQLHVRDGMTCEAMLAALDMEALKDKPSPAALMFYTGMRYGYEFGCGYFNIGGPGDPKRNNHLFEFKRKFKPTLHVAPGPVCVVLGPRRYWLWVHVFLRGWRAWRARFGNRGKKINETTQPTLEPLSDSASAPLDAAGN